MRPLALVGLSLGEWLGLVQAIATVVALYFAWRAVEEARAACREAGRETRLARLERLGATVREISQSFEYGHGIERRRQVEHLKALLQAFPRRVLPKTHAYASHEPASTVDEEYRRLGNESKAELEDAADEAFGH